jgi:hypothetical protein
VRVGRVWTSKSSSSRPAQCDRMSKPTFDAPACDSMRLMHWQQSAWLSSAPTIAKKAYKVLPPCRRPLHALERCPLFRRRRRILPALAAHRPDPAPRSPPSGMRREAASPGPPHPSDVHATPSGCASGGETAPWHRAASRSGAEGPPATSSRPSTCGLGRCVLREAREPTHRVFAGPGRGVSQPLEWGARSRGGPAPTDVAPHGESGRAASPAAGASPSTGGPAFLPEARCAHARSEGAKIGEEGAGASGSYPWFVSLRQGCARRALHRGATVPSVPEHNRHDRRSLRLASMLVQGAQVSCRKGAGN